MINPATAIPFISADECAKLSLLMNNKYASFLGQRSFEASIKKDERGVYAKVILRNRDGSYYYPVEARVLHDEHDLTDMQRDQPPKVRHMVSLAVSDDTPSGFEKDVAPP